jgi:hypothetical protein
VDGFGWQVLEPGSCPLYKVDEDELNDEVVIDTLTWVTRNKAIKMCKVQWSHHGEDKAT